MTSAAAAPTAVTEVEGEHEKEDSVEHVYTGKCSKIFFICLGCFFINLGISVR